jgi:mono/diheme cytochrome c family protein
MKFRSLVVGCVAALFVAFAVHAQSSRPEQAPTTPSQARPQPAAPAKPAQPASPTTRRASTAPAKPTAPAIAVDAQKAFLNQYCMACHSEKAKAAGLDSARRLTMDSLDPANVDSDREKWELVVRKVRAGQMPPLGMKRPDPADFHAMITAFESELDRTAKPFTPPPGLHRLNRTEYANVVRDLLNLDIDASTYLPSDDSTSGFDNIAGALGISSTQVEAYVSAAQKISRLAMGYPTEPTLVVYRTREDTSQDYHVEELPFGTLHCFPVFHTFSCDGQYTLSVTPIFVYNMSPTVF